MYVKELKCSTAYFLKLISPGEIKWDYPKLMPVVGPTMLEENLVKT